MKHYREYFKELKSGGIMTRMMASFVILVIVPYLCLAAVVFFFFQRHTISNLGESTMDTVSVAAAGIHSAMLEREEDSMELYYAGCVELLGRDKALSKQEEQQILDVLSACCYSNTGVLAAYLEVGQEVYHSGGNHSGVLSLMEPHKKEIVAAGGKCLWYVTDELYGKSYENNYILARSLNSEAEKNVGILYLVLNDKMLTDALGMLSTEYATWYLADLEGSVLYSSDISQVGSQLDVSMLSPKKKRSYQKVLNERKQEEIVAAYCLMDVQWYCISRVAVQSIQKNVFSMVQPFLVIVVVCILFMLLMMYMLQKYVFDPLRSLKRSMDQYAKNELWETQIESVGIGEFKSLSVHFNNMTLRIRRLMDAYKEEADEKNRQRMRALSAQLTPHFIYNALNTIKWVAVLNHQEKIQQLVESLVSIFMNAARMDDENYTLKDELELVQNYAVIQKARFMNFELLVEVEEDCLDCQIRKFLLQPIVENAIVHGLNRGKVKDGKITLRAWLDKELHISVADTGIGFDVEQWCSSPKKNDEHTNIGVHNVEEIIRLEYGYPYRLEIDSAPGRGTKIVYVLPVVRKGDGEDDTHDNR